VRAKVVAYTQGMDSDAFLADDRTYDAVLRNLELIGEAAKHVWGSTRKITEQTRRLKLHTLR
jgi:uncharacterized protein with HEPN domain